MLRPKILIADDDPVLLKQMVHRLRNDRFDVIVAHDGYQAVEFAQREHPHVLILDVHMPAGDGFSVQDRLEKLAGLEYVPVIYLTHERSERVIQLVEQHGATCVLYKPFELDHLIDKVEAIVERCGLREPLADHT